MTVDQVFVIRKLQNLEEMYVVYSAVTRMPFATCDEETFNDQVWIFTDQDKVQEFAKSYTEKKMPLIGVKVKKTEAPMFYMNLFAMGINEIVFQDGDMRHNLELTKVVRIPDYEKLPENQRPILNPQLMLSSIYFLQELRKPGVQPDKEALKELEEEMSVNLVKSKYLMPVDVQKNEKGQENIRLLYVQNKQGERFQPIFSDTGELMKHYKNKEQKHRLIQIAFEQLPAHMIKDVQGYVLNPEGINLILKKEQIETLLKYYK
ncbi:SseB family protein [bacterium]|nr:SseB family protein [bacterium]MDY3021111.1 SseB family protein [Oliverpabstia sp.]